MSHLGPVTLAKHLGTRQCMQQLRKLWLQRREGEPDFDGRSGLQNGVAVKELDLMHHVIETLLFGTYAT